MAQTEQQIRVVLVSPSDVAGERAVVQKVVDELNRGVAPDRGFRLALWRWETDARPGVHLDGPQGLIDELMDIQNADIVVGVFWKRFGSPTAEADSGTEHELRRAWAARKERGRPEVMVYFGTRAYSPKDPGELMQWQRVLEFQRELPQEQLWWNYKKRLEFEALLREHLTRYLLRRTAAPEPAPDDDRFAESIRARYAELDMIVERLTADQHRVIKLLKRTKQALITGSAGSGKTLVAAEKAIRVSADGGEALFVCHNPLLADWVSELTAGSGVRVRAFEDLVAELAGNTGQLSDADWTSYSQPTPDVLGRALERLRDADGAVDAVIVDEGQDFDSDWWPLIEACLKDAGTLYIFLDDRQALLPHRGDYPIAGEPLDLSRNCRNAGRVYDLMSRLVSLSEPPEEALANLGDVVMMHAGPGMLHRNVEACLDWLHAHAAIEGVAAVLGGGVHFSDSVLRGGAFGFGPAIDWRSAVYDEFFFMARHATPSVRRAGVRLRDLNALLERLSHEILPTPEDCATVAQAASLLATGVHPGAPRTSAQVMWRPTSDATAAAGGPRMRLHPRGTTTFPFFVLHALQNGEWARALPQPLTTTFAPHRDAGPGTIPVFTVGEIKGLEREAVLLVMQGTPAEPTAELFVGASRARSLLAVALDEHAYRTLRPRVRKLVVSPDFVSAST
jgi:hypothetical protein